MSSVNATVTLTLSELDSLRAEIQKGKDEQQRLKLEMQSIESRSKQIKVTVKVFEQYSVAERVRDFNTGNGNGYIKDSWGMPIPSYKYENVVKNRSTDNIEYVNFDEVIEDLKIRAEKMVTDKLVTLENEATRLRAENVEMQKSKYKEISDLKSSFVRTSDDFQDAYEKKIVVLSDEIKLLKNQEVEKTKDNLIEDLKRQLKEETNKSWTQKLWS